MGEKLDAIARHIERNQEVVFRGIGEKVSEQLHDSQQATANMLGVALNMALVK